MKIKISNTTFERGQSNLNKIKVFLGLLKEILKIKLKILLRKKNYFCLNSSKFKNQIIYLSLDCRNMTSKEANFFYFFLFNFLTIKKLKSKSYYIVYFIIKTLTHIIKFI
jgi:hypothetical protein